MEENNLKYTSKIGKAVLIMSNIVLMTVAIIASLIYSGYVRTSQMEGKESDFITTVESMKQVSQNYISCERGYVENWAAYINQNNMTLKQAMKFLSQLNTNKERFAHIVDMDTFEAYSSYYPFKDAKIDTYQKYHQKYHQKKSDEYKKSFADNMRNIFNGRQDEFNILGKYKLPEIHAPGVSVGTRITLRTSGGKKDYLLLRAIPTYALRKSWIFPVEYSSAEVGIITNSGDYVIQSYSMKSISFPEYIRGYNFQNDYNKADKLIDKLKNTDNGTFIYKNFKKDNCLWYYSSFGDNSSLDILGVVNTDELKSSMNAWLIVFILCGTLLVLSVVDSTYLKRINHKLRVTANLANQASEAKTQFLSAMSHDIRTPMNAVLGMMTIAKSNLDKPDYVEECLNKSMNAGNQLLTLINDVLDISKIESGKLALSPEDISLDDVISDLLEMLTPNIMQKNIELMTDFEKIPYKHIYADQMRLNQIYVNLISNAVKYTNEHGKISISIYEKDSRDSEKTCLVFRVSDTGIGMTEEFQRNMYNSFSRAVNTQVNRTQGSGLGLSIVKQVVDLMGGTIECDSIPGEGTTFTVYIDFPIVETVISDESENDNINNDLKSLKLLVAEDNELNWEIISVLLSEQGIVCDRAENGKICVDMISSVPHGTYDAILMDIQMPVMNGIDATRHIRALSDPYANQIPIIAMTADAFAEDVRACEECGMNGHIAKPIDMGKLLVYLGKLKGNKADMV